MTSCWVRRLTNAVVAFLVLCGGFVSTPLAAGDSDVDEKGKEGAQAAPRTRPPEWKIFWKDGLRAERGDARIKFRVGGRVHYDWSSISESAGVRKLLGDQEGGGDLRRARAYVSGDLGRHVAFKAEYDFAPETVEPRDVFLDFQRLPGIGHLQVGHFKEPFSIGELTSSNSIVAVERSLPNVFVPARNVGVAVGDALFDQRVTWSLGFFRETNGFDGFKTASNAVTGRGTWLPWYEKDGERLLHLGVAYSERFIRDTVRFRARPEAQMAARFVDTGNLRADRVHLLGLEGAAVRGPFALQSEYIQARLGTSSGPAPVFHGFSAEATYSLTGEPRAYRKSAGVFDRLEPKRSVGRNGGPGAWELVFRYSTLDLNDRQVVGRVLHNVTGGVNWYLNPNARILFNYARAHLADTGNTHVVQMRFQVAF